MMKYNKLLRYLSLKICALENTKEIKAIYELKCLINMILEGNFE